MIKTARIAPDAQSSSSSSDDEQQSQLEIVLGSKGSHINSKNGSECNFNLSIIIPFKSTASSHFFTPINDS